MTSSPLMTVSAGAVLPTDSQLDEFDIESYLLKHPRQSFYIVVDGSSMEGRGVSHGDILVIDKTLTPHDGSIIIARVGDGFTVKQYDTSLGRLRLVPANAAYSPIEPLEGSILCGVATFVIKRL